MNISSYDIVQELLRHAAHTVYRARRKTDQQPVLLKLPARVPPRSSDYIEIEREFELLNGLAIDGVPDAYEVIREGDVIGLVLEDRGLQPLRRIIDARRLELASFLPMAIELSIVLGELHRRKITHGAISPTSILTDAESGKVQLLHIGMMAPASSERGALSAVGTPYVSPEQTGRMNRAVDYRTDFYSLGATLYEVLTGTPPFVSDDSLELIHAHIAKAAVSPSQLDVRIPAQVSRVLLKLLAKAAEDRYQSALGIQRDLERCQQEWTEQREISVFDLGTQDVSERFLISQKLYGRERELADLLAALEDTCKGQSSLLLVAGYSGIGKTSLIQELYRPIVRERGYFIAGKFDQVVRNIPYGAFTQALRSLVWQLLTESEDRLSEWRRRLGDALGANGGVLAEVLPEIELILGKQPPPPPLEPTEARNRFRYVFQRFVGTLAQKEHPLVVFLDDLQWVDAATLDLLHALVTAADIQHLLLIGAYRDNEVDAAHALTWAVDRLEASGSRIARLALGPLAMSALVPFLCDTLRAPSTMVEPLAALIHKRTDGNPFFVIQLLKTLEQDGLFRFDRGLGRWTFTLEAIAAAGITDNVVDLMTAKIRRLSRATQEVLTFAACVGNPFDWQTLLTVSRLTPEQVSSALSEATDAGLLYQAGETSAADERPPERAQYAFIHDRVQQAAYGFIPDAEKQTVHLDVGRLLLADFDAAAPDDRIFAILNHLNIGSDGITEPAERMAVARLNLTAGRKAKSAAAYRASVDYFSKGIALLDASYWSSEYELMFALHLELAEAEYLAGAFDRSAQYFEFLLAHAANNYDKAQVHLLRMTLCEHQSRWADAVASGRDGLRLFEIDFPTGTEEKAAALDREVNAVQQLVGTRSIASLIELPEMHDASMRMVMRLLTILWAPAYISGDQVLARLISATLVRLSLLHGNTADSAYGYVTHAITIGPVRRDYRTAYEFGELALAVSRRFGELKHRAKIHQQFQAHVNLWRRPFETCIPHAREACRSGLEAGDFTYAGYGAATEAWSALLISRDVKRFVRDYSPTLALLDKLKMVDFSAAHRVLLNWALALQGRTSGPLSLSDASFDEHAFIRKYEDTAPFFLTFVYAARLHLAIVFGDWQEALAAADRARDVAVGGTIWPVLVEYWGGLAAAHACDHAPGDKLAGYRRRIADAEASLGALADNCPANFRCAALLLAAERHRVDLQYDRAAELYDQAIAFARETRSVQEEALAHEHAGRLALARGDSSRAAALLAAAHRAYASWGATAKLAHLEDRYSRLLAGTVSTTAAPSVVIADEVRDELSSVDMSTVLKVAHAIAVELEVGGLLRTLMRLALENAGAERGVFLQERGGALIVEAEATAAAGQVTIGRPTPVDDFQDLAQSVVRYVHRTGQDVVVGNASADERFAADGYVARSGVRSILCVPVGQHGRVGGILYLDNSLASDAFTPARIEMMRVLAAQTAISLENARLYEEMKSEVARRTVAEHALREALAEVEALKNRLEAENVYLQEEIRTQHNFNEIVGGSPALLDALRKVERVAATDSTVLIVGETGSGKELFARAVHSRSKRGSRPLVKVNCGAIAPGLVESELFGHIKGAFTGAIEKRIGRFEVANGGTIFLDEVGELPLDAQVKLLRVLQEQEFEPVGSSRTVRVSVRVIAATNRNLDQAVRDGRFRADLLYRLNVFPIEVPSLRERPSDIPLLVGFFATSLARKLGKPIQGFSARDMDRMLTYSWPGNVRELQNVVERAAILARGPILELADTVLGAAPLDVRGGSRPASAVPVAPFTPSPGESLDEIQRVHILSVLESTGGVVEGAKGAATILGLHPNTLRSRMKKLGISRTGRPMGSH